MNKEVKMLISIVNAFEHTINEEHKKKHIDETGFRNLKRFQDKLWRIIGRKTAYDNAKNMGISTEQVDDILGELK